MREIIPGRLWIGNAKDADSLLVLMNAGVKAVVGLALEELLATLLREMVYCRFPLVDGEGNRPELLSLAIQTTSLLITQEVPTLICCGAGMSRSPAVAAAALAKASGQSLDECLRQVAGGGPCDVSPGLWEDVKALCDY